MKGFRMKRPNTAALAAMLLGFVCQCLSPHASDAQSLAEVARKERARRQELGASSPPARVIREGELVEASGQGLSVTGVEAASETLLPEGESVVASPSMRGADHRERREEWDRLWRLQVAAAERELESAKDAAFQCEAASRYFWVPLAIDCNGVDERLADAEARLKEIRRNRYRWDRPEDR